MNINALERLIHLIVIYLDNCCYSRLTDEDTRLNVIAEAAKIQTIIDNRFFGGYMIAGSRIVTIEMENNPNDAAREKSMRTYRSAVTGEVGITAQVIARAQGLESNGLRPMDARHLAAAEAIYADYLLTTDLDFIKKCSKPDFTTVKVINPIDF